MKRGMMLAGLLLAATCVAGCDYGKKIEFDNFEIYYTEAVTEAEAQKVGEFFAKSKTEQKRSMQLDRRDDTYIIRMVMRDDYQEFFKQQDQDYVANMRILANYSSKELLNGNPVEMHLTDKYFKPHEVVTMDAEAK